MQEYGRATFTLDGKSYTFNDLSESRFNEKWKSIKIIFFCLFVMKSNQKETYGGGKIYGFKNPEKGSTIVLDFNQSYQPFCAYNAYDYNCLIVPEENKLPVEIRAGVMYNDIYHH
ncbi:DUF1684 domain-containing protein [Chryseobacterium indoltheticum]|uniref:DUF1684 domain-containing protein n=1 Tax=Chryseobacterium indoltheticum TaxID=254 RepID=UPI003F49328E